MTKRQILFSCIAVFIMGVSLPMGTLAASDQPSSSEQTATGTVQKEKTKPNATARKKAAAKNSKEKSKKGVHAAEWVFNDGSRSSDAWRDGVPSETLQKRAVGEQASKDKSVNTASGINSALNAAGEQHRRKGGMGVSVGQQSSAWREPVVPDHEAPDENLPMESRHVVRAYADMSNSDDLSISVGPELILKNEQRERATVNKQPESSLGMGMQFKLDF
jgi:hypothetical protein